MPNKSYLGKRKHISFVIGNIIAPGYGFLISSDFI